MLDLGSGSGYGSVADAEDGVFVPLYIRIILHDSVLACATLL